jgi:hypothetical protein
VISQLRVINQGGLRQLRVVSIESVTRKRVTSQLQSSRRSNCDTADGSNRAIVRASAINSLYSIRREVTCRFIHPTRDNMMNQ